MGFSSLKKGPSNDRISTPSYCPCLSLGLAVACKAGSALATVRTRLSRAYWPFPPLLHLLASLGSFNNCFDQILSNSDLLIPLFGQLWMFYILPDLTFIHIQITILRTDISNSRTKPAGLCF